MSQKALPALPQGSSSSNTGTPSSTKFSDVVEGSLEDVAQYLSILRVRYDSLQTSLNLCKVSVQGAANKENREVFIEYQRTYEAMIEDCKQDIAGLEVEKEQLEARRASGHRDVALDGPITEPYYLTTHEMDCHEIEVEVYTSLQRWQDLQYRWRAEDIAREAEDNARGFHRARKSKFDWWRKFRAQI
ncbi:hypothetical protein PENSPDRAFT_662935 [Peniophora sp. CONT]|nr:hypothetical protein PENSPDRAFT_662935 [Peniophora sp. CONT]